MLVQRGVRIIWFLYAHQSHLLLSLLKPPVWEMRIITWTAINKAPHMYLGFIGIVKISACNSTLWMKFKKESISSWVCDWKPNTRIDNALSRRIEDRDVARPAKTKTKQQKRDNSKTVTRRYNQTYVMSL